MFWCNLGFHKWSKWSTPVPAKWKQQYVKYGLPIGDWEERHGQFQKRDCERCGEYQEKTVDLNSIS